VIVLDASAAIEWLLRSPIGHRIEERILSRLESMHVPHLLDLEVAQVLRRHVVARTITAPRGSKALHDLRDLPLVRYATVC
jgi:predicted nucleic acid-binding protein